MTPAATPAQHDWTRSVASWSGFLLHQGWRIGIADELRLHSLAAELHNRKIEVTSVEAAMRWFGPLLCSSADEQQRLPALLALWQPPAASTAAPLEPELERAARAVIPPRQAFGVSAAQIVRVAMVAALLLGLALLAWQYFIGLDRTTPPPDQAAVAARPVPGPVNNDDTGPAERFGGALLWSLPCAAAFAVRRLRLRRREALMRGLAPRDAARETLAIALPHFALYTLAALRAAVADLRRHRLVDAAWIDGARSAAATVRNGGQVTLVAGKRRTSPEYLLLVDLRRRDDMLGALADLLVRLLEDGDVRVERYDFVGDARHLRRVTTAGVTRTPRTTRTTRTADNSDNSDNSDEWDLDTLRATCPEHRLLVLSDGAGFADARGGGLRSWVRDLLRWREAALVTPLPPAQWGPRERALSRLGLAVVEATPAGLAQLAQRLRTDRPADASLGSAELVGAAGARATALDRRFAADPYRWLADVPPTPTEQQAVLAELREVLDARAYLYLQALAVFPALQPRLTLALGRLLVDAEGLVVLDELTLARLCRVPWLREGRLPDWLRLALLRALPAADADRVRAAWSVLLAPATHAAAAAGSADSATETLTLEAVRSVDPALPPVVAEALARSPSSRHREALLLAFMDQRALPELAVALPARGGSADLSQHIDRLPEMDRALLGWALILGVMGWWLAPWAWGLAWLGESTREQFAGALWTLGATAGLLTLITWYRRELGPMLRGRWPWFEAPAAQRALWNTVPEASAVAALALALAAVQVEGWQAFVPGRVVLALWLVLWCFLGHGRAVLVWAPVLVALNLGAELPLVGWLRPAPLAWVLVVWLGTRERWADLRALLGLCAPLLALEWSLAPGLRVSGGVASFVVLWLLTRFVADDTFRSRWLLPQRLDLTALWVLLLPLGAAAALWTTDVLTLRWYPLVLLLAACYLAGLLVPRSGRWMIALMVLIASMLVLVLNAWPASWIENTLSFAGTPLAASPKLIWTPPVAWWLGVVSRPGSRPWHVAAAVALTCLYSGFWIRMEPAGAAGRAVSSAALDESVLFLALLPALLARGSAGVRWSAAIGFVVWTLLMALAAWAGLRLGDSELQLRVWSSPSLLVHVAALAGMALLLRARLPAAPHWQLSPSSATPERLRLLDWGRWTWPAVLAGALLMALTLAVNLVAKPVMADAGLLPSTTSSAPAPLPTASVPASAPASAALPVLLPVQSPAPAPAASVAAPTNTTRRPALPASAAASAPRPRPLNTKPPAPPPDPTTLCRGQEKNFNYFSCMRDECRKPQWAKLPACQSLRQPAAKVS